MSANPESSAEPEWWRLDDGALLESVRDDQSERRARYISQVGAVAQMWERRGCSKEGRTAIMADLTGLCELSRAEAHEVFRHAELFGSSAIRETARAALLSRDHLNVIHKTLSEAPESDREQVEASLLECAVTLNGEDFKKIGLRILQLLDQDGKAPDDRELAEPKREFQYTSRKDGSVVFRGKIDQEAGAKLAALMGPLAKPKSGKDPRTTAERQGDAFVDIIELAATSDDLPDHGGERPHLALTMPLDDFVAMKHTAEVEGMGPINAASARRIACDSTVMRVVLGAKSEVLDIGRQTRTIPNAIRRALIARDTGCSFPGCTTRPRQCAGHHITHWA